MRGEGLTLFPSVWREGGCESHFIVWRRHILFWDRLEEGNSEPVYNPEIEDAVICALHDVQPPSAVEFAEAIDELVWDVNRAAVRLGSGKSIAGGFLQNRCNFLNKLVD